MRKVQRKITRRVYVQIRYPTNRGVFRACANNRYQAVFPPAPPTNRPGYEATLLAYLVVRGNSEGPLFLLRGKLLTRPKLVLKLRKAVAVTGLQPEKYAGHSFRIGATTTTAVCGVPVDVIKTLGQWKSQAYQLYVRIPAAQLA